MPFILPILVATFKAQKWRIIFKMNHLHHFAKGRSVETWSCRTGRGSDIRGDLSVCRKRVGVYRDCHQGLSESQVVASLEAHHHSPSGGANAPYSMRSGSNPGLRDGWYLSSSEFVACWLFGIGLISLVHRIIST